MTCFCLINGELSSVELPPNPYVGLNLEYIRENKITGEKTVERNIFSSEEALIEFIQKKTDAQYSYSMV